MDPKRWERVKRLFEAAADLEGEARDAYLRGECGNDAALRSEVENLLAADDTEHGLLDRPAVAHFDELSEADMIGRPIGAYRVVRKIASGGMGSVYFAERADGQFEQQVAIKVIRPGMVSESAVGRFAQERQMLAGLEHPHIARLVDGGVTESGEPYFAMEYVDGLPVTEYCDRHGLSVEQRVELFRTVCETVQFAHQNLIVHRDIKPTNIMIDTAGVVKLVDFGIAKLLDQPEDGAGSVGLTQTRGQVMTPAYASPEQRAGQPVSTATDVYSLGVVLYELLTGERPFDFDGMSPAAIEQWLVTTPPERPSVRLSRSADSGRNESETTGSPRDQFRSALSGDLDNICLMALRVEPERRYASAGQFADDLRRYRERQPVVARPNTFGYRTQKFISRHRGVVSAAAIFVLLVAGLSTVYVTRLADERDRARLEASKASSMADFLVGLFEAADPNESKGEEFTVLELVEAGRERIAVELADQPEVRASMTVVLANTLQQLGRLEDARDLFAQVAEMEGIGLEEKAQAVHLLGVAYYDLGHYDSAAICYHRSLDINLQLFGEFNAAVATDLNDLAAAIKRTAGLDSAEVLFRRALTIRRELLDGGDLDIAHSLNHLGRVLWGQGRYEEAEPLLLEGLEIRLAALGDEHFEVIASRGALAGLYTKTGRYDDAIATYERCLRSMRKLVGEEHPHVGGLLGSLAAAHLEASHYAVAESLYAESEAIFNAVLPAGHVRQALPLIGRASVCIATDRAAEAEPLLRRALAIRISQLTAESHETAETQSQLGSCLATLGQVTEAESLLRAALAVQVHALGEDHPATIQTRKQLEALPGLGAGAPHDAMTAAARVGG